MFNNKKYYILESVDKGNTINEYSIFSIFFLDIITLVPSFTNVYISNISKKKDLISGSESMKMVIKICKKIKTIKKLFLLDYAEINCNKSNETIDLSLYKLILNNYTFYSKFGFMLYDKNKYIQTKLLYYSKIVGNYKVINIIKEFNNIINFITINYNNEIKGDFIDRFSKLIFNDNINYSDKKRIIIGYNYLITIFEKYRNIKFKNMIKLLLENECHNLFTLFYMLDYNNYYKFYYEKNKISSKFLLEYTKLYILRNNYQYQGYFVKNI